MKGARASAVRHAAIHLTGRQGLMVFPRDANPYQELLYDELALLDWDIRYIGELSSSQTLNIALLPIQVAYLRVRGFRLLHLHWLFGFVPTWARRPGLARKVFRLWFRICLAVLGLLGVRLVWTAHNAMPHSPVFDDDEKARRLLVRRCTAIIAMNSETVGEVRQRFAVGPVVRLIPHGNYDAAYGIIPSLEEARRTLGVEAEAFVLASVGRVEEYKGFQDLPRAVAASDELSDVMVVVAGRCSDPTLREEIISGMASLHCDTRLELVELSSDRMVAYLRAATCVVFPFRSVSTSGSLIFAMGLGSLCIVPDLPVFQDIPDDALVRYPAGRLSSLAEALVDLKRASPEIHSRTREAARAYVAGLSWRAIAASHDEVFRGTG